MLSGAAGVSWAVPESLKRAALINPEPGSTYMDAEHVVILMQENRSFDHCFGTLQGVRGYNDPWAITQPNGNKVWLQSGKEGHTCAPFRFDIDDTKITWMGSIPHTCHSQIDAWNHGKHDGWIDAKHSGHQKYAPIPLTMGHYSREDLPFNYAMADAFTICDHNFCSLLGPTRPNRLFLFTGTNRSAKNGDARPILENEGVYHWKTMPEWLEENDVSWRIYQNDISKRRRIDRGTAQKLAFRNAQYLASGVHNLKGPGGYPQGRLKRYFHRCTKLTRNERLSYQIYDVLRNPPNAPRRPFHFSD